MSLDIRLPIGLLFLCLGGLLAVYGLATMGDAGLYRRSLDINVNLAWGGALLVFGGVMTYYGRARKAKPPADPTA